MPVCEVCGASAKTLKSLKSKRHLNSKNHLTALATEKIDHTEEPKSSTSKFSASIKMLERRVEALEQQNAIILNKLNMLTKTESVESFIQLNLDEIEKVKQILLNRLEYGNPTNIDTLSIIFADYNWLSVERAILDLSREAEISLEEGESQLKVNGKYALLTRCK